MKITPKQTLDEVKKAAFRELKQDMTDVLDGLARIDGHSTSAVVNNAPATKVTSNPKDVFVTTRFVEDGFHGSVASPENFQIMTRPEYSDVQLASRGDDERGVDQFLTENSANLTFSDSVQTLVTSDSATPKYDLSDVALAKLWDDMVKENSRSDAVVAQESRQHNAWLNRAKNAFGELNSFVRNLRKEESVGSQNTAVAATPVEPTKAKEVLPTIVAEAPKASSAPAIVVAKSEPVVVEKPAVPAAQPKVVAKTEAPAKRQGPDSELSRLLAARTPAEDDSGEKALMAAFAGVRGEEIAPSATTEVKGGLGEGTSRTNVEIGELAKAEGGSNSPAVFPKGTLTADETGKYRTYPMAQGSQTVALGADPKSDKKIVVEIPAVDFEFPTKQVFVKGSVDYVEGSSLTAGQDPSKTTQEGKARLVSRDKYVSKPDPKTPGIVMPEQLRNVVGVDCEMSTSRYSLSFQLSQQDLVKQFPNGTEFVVTIPGAEKPAKITLTFVPPVESNTAVAVAD